MTAEEKVRIWTEKGRYDLETARAMLKTRRYLYVGFLCQQAIEKILKAYYISQKRSEAPYTHNLRFLAESVGLELSKETLHLLDQLVAYYIVGRYPSYKEHVARKLSERESKILLEKTERVFLWFHSLLKSRKR